MWPSFCGHIFALASNVQDLDRKIGNPGVRVVISYGRLFQIYQPKSWRRYPIAEYTQNWFVLTGASEALIKCTEVERLGRRNGFQGGYCWHEIPGSERVYLGTPFFVIPLEHDQQPDLYPTFYELLCKRADKRVELSAARSRDEQRT